MRVDQYLFSHISFWGPLISTSNHTPLIYRCPIKISYWMKPTYYLSTIIIKSIDSMYLKDDSYMAPCHLVWHCKDDLVNENIGGHLSLSKKKEKEKWTSSYSSTLMCDVCSSPTTHARVDMGDAYHCHGDLAHPTQKSQVTCHVIQVSNNNQKKYLIERIKLSLEIIEL